MTNKQKAKKYLTKIVSEGAKEIKITWDGGNDEGSFYLYVDGEDINIDWDKKDGTYDLVDYIGDEIGYGSFAGDFYTNGEIIYDHDKKAFLGYDSCEESNDHTYKFRKPLKLTIPKDLWFDTVEIDASGYSDEMDINVKLSVTNGPVIQDHIDFESNSTKAIEKVCNQLFDDIDEVRDVWHNSSIINREELEVDEEGNPHITLTSFMYSKYETFDKEIQIQL
jgi:hypothetical protein